MTFKIYCTNCKTSAEFKVELKRDSLNKDAWGDIICKECGSIIITCSTDKTGEHVATITPTVKDR